MGTKHFPFLLDAGLKVFLTKKHVVPRFCGCSADILLPALTAMQGQTLLSGSNEASGEKHVTKDLHKEKGGFL